jgi:hypothetical protein
LSEKETHKGGNYSVNSAKEDNNSGVGRRREGSITPSMIQRKELDLPDYKAKSVEV